MAGTCQEYSFSFFQLWAVNLLLLSTWWKPLKCSQVYHHNKQLWPLTMNKTTYRISLVFFSWLDTLYTDSTSPPPKKKRRRRRKKENSIIIITEISFQVRPKKKDDTFITNTIPPILPFDLRGPKFDQNIPIFQVQIYFYTVAQILRFFFFPSSFFKPIHTNFLHCIGPLINIPTGRLGKNRENGKLLARNFCDLEGKK